MTVSPSPRIPTYRRHKPTGQAVVTLNGKDHYLGKHGTPASREKYGRLIAEWLERGGQTPSAPDPGRPPHGLTVNELILGYLRHCATYYADAPKEREKIKLA